MSLCSHKMLETNPIHIWKLQTNTNHFQHISIFFCHFCILQTRTIFHILVSKIHFAYQIIFKLSQLGDFIVPSQSWKFQPRRVTTLVFISWSVFFKSGSRGLYKDAVLNLFPLNSGVVHFVEGSYFTHTLHLISAIVLQIFNMMTWFLCILQTRKIF